MNDDNGFAAGAFAGYQFFFLKKGVIDFKIGYAGFAFKKIDVKPVVFIGISIGGAKLKK